MSSDNWKPTDKDLKLWADAFEAQSKRESEMDFYYKLEAEKERRRAAAKTIEDINLINTLVRWLVPTVLLLFLGLCVQNMALIVPTALVALGLIFWIVKVHRGS